MRRIQRLCSGIYDVWMNLQVELHGSYSISRMRFLSEYSSSTSVFRASVFVIIAPFPCLIILTMIDCVPLAPTEDGSRANYLFWGRNYLTISLMTRAILEQLHLTVPSLDFTFIRTVCISALPSAGAVAFMLAMTSLIGFPLPFTLVIGIPVWFVGLVICFGIFFGSKLRRESEVRTELLNYIVVIACQVVLTFIYPAYLYGFRSVSSTVQTFYVLLLPIIKIATKNWISFFLGTKDDLKPQVVILNIEVFNALYVASSMQNATSISTTMALTFVDFALAWISIKDVNFFLADITALLMKIPSDHPLKTANFMEIALKMLDEDVQLRADSALRLFSVRIPASSSRPVRVRSLDPAVETNFPSRHNLFPTASILPKLPSIPFLTGATVMPARKETYKPFRELFTTKQRMDYVHRTAQVLFTTEFIILIEFTEVIIPFIYSTYTIAMFQLPNRVFYPQIRALNRTTLGQMIGNIAVYGLMELLSFIAMSVILRRKLGISTLHQLAFVLDRERRMVQSNLFLWICYTIQNSLDHNGADFSWKFSWLKKSN
ncbi:hypothetical protein PPTG_02363 [Phytophthora nicotianae INRA-310]|uniref:Uncharacterized protein n=1 Tax=Phytophthora nicotianae (strain INRA-310) TaxID=761204 RepID=W2RAH8_PHYN3|nr:hypothetical protein PPTG_02363 [Phytophthora nicotianae INRA-310]ETN22418.1 hypothetical protein PPTG_02363 [Phytophthora nicotianae INRA-310]